MTQKQSKVLVIGHRNPDTDSICSAIAYANLKNASENTDRYEPCRAGEINQETAFALKRFHTKTPRRCVNVRAEVQDIDIRKVPGVAPETTVRKSWQNMRDTDAHSQPIVDENGKLLGLVTLSDISKANMDSLDNTMISRARTPVSNIVEALEGTILSGDPNTVLESGKVVIGAGSPEAMEAMVEPGDLVLLANRAEMQLTSIEIGVACIIVCMGANVSKTIVKIAQEHNCVLITTPYDTYTSSNLLRQAVPICTYMTPAEKMLFFRPGTPVEEVKKVMGRVRYVYFPVESVSGKYLGLISRRNLLNLKRKQLILVDHNEKTQCVDGFEEAEILEVIDHHRIGNIETTGPVFFRNQPVGCTATIVTQMYREQGVEITADIAGLLLCAILSDTLAFRSPTCTPLDIRIAEDLSKIAGVETQALAEEMFEAGENVDGRTAEEVFFQDYKVFTHGDIRFGVAQGSFMSLKNLNKAKELLSPYLKEAMQRENVQMIFCMLTNVKEQSSVVLFEGKDAADVMHDAFALPEIPEAMAVLPGMVSRKKQMIPAILNVLQ